MAITKTSEVVGIRFHAASTQPTIGLVAEKEDVFFVDSLVSYTDSDTNVTTTQIVSNRLKANSDISSESTVTQAVWGIFFADTAQEQAAIALAAAAALAAATSATNTVTNITTST